MGHGRIEIRECYHSDEIAALPRVKEFARAKSIAMVRSTRIIGETRTAQVRSYISSLEMDAEKLTHAVRTHGSVENSLHWTLDMSFREDDSRMREGFSAENFAMMRRMALSIMKRDVHSKRSLKGRRRICSYPPCVRIVVARNSWNSEGDIEMRYSDEFRRRVVAEVLPPKRRTARIQLVDCISGSSDGDGVVRRSGPSLV
jgi:predicted transposase YbfD/YdcC